VDEIGFPGLARLVALGGLLDEFHPSQVIDRPADVFEQALEQSGAVRLLGMDVNRYAPDVSPDRAPIDVH
jgi:hypothetical protein